MSCPFYIVDVFSHRPFAGNPVAIVLAPDEDEETMRRVAGWTGMPETVFITRPSFGAADYAVRIFSPARELAFAGHPSIGACHLLLERGLVSPRDGTLQQQCQAGLVEMRVDGEANERTIAFSVHAEMVAQIDPETLPTIGEALGRRPKTAFVVRAGARWVVARFDTAAEIASLQPSFARVRDVADRESALGVSVYGPSPDEDADIEVRSFAPSIGVDEDAVCGGGNACVAAVIAREGVAESMIVSQGRHRGRRGRVHLTMPALDGRIRIAGRAVTSVSGAIALPA